MELKFKANVRMFPRGVTCGTHVLELQGTGHDREGIMIRPERGAPSARLRISEGYTLLHESKLSFPDTQADKKNWRNFIGTITLGLQLACCMRSSRLIEVVGSFRFSVPSRYVGRRTEQMSSAYNY